MNELSIGLGMWIVIIGGYFLPWIIASTRKHNSKSAIACMTLLLGWTGAFWLFALIWSLTGNVQQKVNG